MSRMGVAVTQCKINGLCSEEASFRSVYLICLNMPCNNYGMSPLPELILLSNKPYICSSYQLSMEYFTSITCEIEVMKVS